MRRRTTKHLREELNEIDYLDKLNKKEREYLLQFLFEFYQGDFNYNVPIHPEKYVKECRDRNNASKRQIHSVGGELLDVSVNKVREAQFNPKRADRYYTPEDYIKEYPDDTDEEEDD